MKRLLIIVLGIVLGLALGFYLFSETQRRLYLKSENCDNCLELNEITGLLTSIGVNNAPDLFPNVVEEIDKVIVLEHPKPQTKIHYLILPKKDIKDIADVTMEDQEYINSAITVIGELVRENGLENYRVITNGPGYQSVRYLHFHLISNENP